MANIRQQKPFFLLCFFEFFERFGYYGFSYTAILFFMNKNGLGFTETEAVLLFGGFASLTYVFNAIGGYVGDSILGIKRTMFLGALFLLIGYASLAISAYYPGYEANIYLSLSSIIVGSALFKPSPTNLISRIYTDEKQLDSVYTYFYMSINMGSLIASSLIPIVAAKYGYPIAYSICSIGFAIGIANTVYSYSSIKDIDNSVGHTNVKIIKIAAAILACVIVISGLSYILKDNNAIDYILAIGALAIFVIFVAQIFIEKEHKAKMKIIAAIVLLIYAILFFIIYQQKMTSFLLFNLHHVNLNVFGYNINPQSIPGVLNTTGVIVLSPILAILYMKSGDRDLSLPFKFAIGILCCGLAYGTMFLACYLNSPDTKINILWEVLSITIFFSLGELLISALGLSLMAKLLPKRITGFAMGTWFIAAAIGIKLGSLVATSVASTLPSSTGTSFTANMTALSYYKFENLFGMIALVAIIFALLAFMIGKKLDKMIQNDYN